MTVVTHHPSTLQQPYQLGLGINVIRITLILALPAMGVAVLGGVILVAENASFGNEDPGAVVALQL